MRSPTEDPGIHDADRLTPDPGDPLKGTREAYFKRSGGFTECDVYDRLRLDPGTAFAGPAVVEEPNSTTVVPPGDEVTVDEYGNLHIEVGGEAES